MNIKHYKDAKGRNYFNVYFHDKESVLSLGRYNYEFKGTPKFVLRKGVSKFGEQLLFQFFIDKRLSKYEAGTKHDTFEVYFSADELDDMIEALIILKELNK